MTNPEKASCLHLFFEHATDVCVQLDSDGRAVDCNPPFVRLTGIPVADLVGRHYSDFLVSEDGALPELDAAASKAVAFRASVNCSDGRIVRLDWKLLGAEDGWGLIGADQTSQEMTRSSLLSAEKMLSAVLETTVDGIITIDRMGLILTANRATEEIFGYSVSELVGRNVSMLMPEPYRDEHDDYIDRYVETGERRIIGIGREVKGRRKDGSVFPMDLAVSEVNVDGGRFFTGIVRDITQRRDLEREILRISEEERRRIGQDLHDELGQMLTGTGLLALSLTKKMAEKELPEAEEMAEITKLIKEADQYARMLARGLVPVELQERGLSSALLRLASDAATLFGVDCVFHEHGTGSLNDLSKTVHLYRIAQEAISNASKHGRASRIRVDLIGAPELIRLRIRDNGSGFVEDWQAKAGMGVHIMHYRAKLIGGSLDIMDIPDGGTMVQCHVPVSKKPAS